MRAVCQKWEESERGFGVRPNGYSLHMDDNDRELYIRAYWSTQPAYPPHEHSRPCGTPYECDIDDATEIELVRLKDLEPSTHGLRFYDNEYPGSGGTDGWMPIRETNSNWPVEEVTENKKYTQAMLDEMRDEPDLEYFVVSIIEQVYRVCSYPKEELLEKLANNYWGVDVLIMDTLGELHPGDQPYLFIIRGRSINPKKLLTDKPVEAP